MDQDVTEEKCANIPISTNLVIAVTSSQIQYFCELCSKSYCENCTVKGSHLHNFYENEDTNQLKCERIHQ